MTTYKDSGVNIENTDLLVKDISKLSKSTKLSVQKGVFSTNEK